MLNIHNPKQEHAERGYGIEKEPGNPAKLRLSLDGKTIID